jgi:uncharacterized caspase-like protein
LTLSSCAPGQISWEDEKLGDGVFTHFLLEGLAGKAERSKNDWHSILSVLRGSE